MQNHPTYVFDLDGVITNPQNSVVNSDVLQKIHDLLAGGVNVAVNTGRSYRWVQENLKTFLDSHNNPRLFDCFFVVCEKGGEKISWHNGQLATERSQFGLTEQEIAAVHGVYSDNASSLNTMFWDATKHTMATIEKKPDASLDEFQVEQKHLVELLSELADEKLRVDSTTIATDVERMEAGKYAGGELVYEWAKSKGASENFISFGDSASDYAMAKCFADHGARSQLIFVGNATKDIHDDERVDYQVTQEQYDAGTYEYLLANWPIS